MFRRYQQYPNQDDGEQNIQGEGQGLTPEYLDQRLTTMERGLKESIKESFSEFLEQAGAEDYKANNPEFYDITLGSNQPMPLQYKNRKHVYVFSNIATTLSSSDFTTNVPAGVWSLLDFREGTRLSASPAATLIFVATNEILPPAVPINAAGQVITSLPTVPANDTTSINEITASGVTTSQTGPDILSSLQRGAAIFLNVTAITAGSVQVIAEMKDTLTGLYSPVLTATAVTAASTVRYVVYPGIAGVAGQNVSDVLAGTWRIRAVVVTGPATFTVDYDRLI